MKKFLKIVFFITLIITSIALLFVGNGYKMYKDAIQEISIEDKIKEIKSKENYTEISDLPQNYIIKAEKDFTNGKSFSAFMI